MTKSELIAELARRTSLSKTGAAEVLGHLAEIAADALAAEDGSVTLPGIVKLAKRRRAARVGRNPQTGERIEIAAKTTVTAKPTSELKVLAA